MGRTKAPNKDIVTKIKDVLRKSPNGLWTREISRQSNVSKSCVHVYLTEHMSGDVEEVLSISGLVRLYRLKVRK